MTENEKDPADRAAALEASGEYRVLRKLPRKTAFNADDGTPTKVGIILDIETTGLNPASDEIIELGMLKFTFGADGRIFKVLDTFSELREPGIAIPAEVAELTGITPDMVAGRHIDPDQVARFVEDAVVIIAHGASFDRPFSEKLFPVFAEKHWACSNTQIDWQARGHRGTKLTYLLNDFGLFYDGHRALDDCHAVLAVLSSVCRVRPSHPSARSSKPHVKPPCASGRRVHASSTKTHSRDGATAGRMGLLAHQGRGGRTSSSLDLVG